MSAPPLAAKRISAAAYDALAEALAVIYWNKQPFQQYVRRVLYDHPAIVARLDFNAPKRVVAGTVVALLQGDDASLRRTALNLMVEISEMAAFPNLARQSDSAVLIATAEAAVVELRRLTSKYRGEAEEQERLAERLRIEAETREAERLFTDSLAGVRDQFIALHSHSNPQARGREFELLIHKLFTLHDLQPRLAYDLEHEQIDGSFTFDTDDYLLEAKWWKDPIQRDQADAFASKIKRKGRNTLGLFLAVNGFTTGFVNTPHDGGMPFMAMDGGDLFHVLDRRIGLIELLTLKKRHLNETGECLLRPI